MSDDAFDALRSDPALGPVVEKHGPVTLEPADDIFRRLVVSIVSQQVSTQAATAIRERLFDSVEMTPEAVVATERETLREAGLSAQKTEYVRNVASAFLERDYSPAHFAGMDDGAVVDELTAIRGVGPWTGKMFLIFCLGREDVFPVEDLGIRKGVQALHDEELSRVEMIERAERWRPHRSYASLYLWRAVD